LLLNLEISCYNIANEDSGLIIGDKYLCVVVKYSKANIFVVTAYFADRIKKGEVIWKK